MKLVVTSAGADLDSPVDPRFGRAQRLLLVETDDMTFEAMSNPAAQSAGGAGPQAAQAVAAAGAKAVITGNVGPNAHRALSAAGLKVYIGATGTVREVVAAYSQGALEEAAAPSVESHFGLRQASG